MRASGSVLAADPGARFLGGGTLAGPRRATAATSRSARLVLSEASVSTAITHRRRSRRDRRRRDHGADRARIPGLAFLHPVAARSAGRRCAPWRRSAAISSRRRPMAISRWRCWRSARRWRSRTPDGSETIGPRGVPRRAPRKCGTHRRAQCRFPLPAEGAFRFLKVVRKHPHGASVLSIAALLPLADGSIARRARRLWRDGADADAGARGRAGARRQRARCGRHRRRGQRSPARARAAHRCVRQRLVPRERAAGASRPPAHG